MCVTAFVAFAVLRLVVPVSRKWWTFRSSWPGMGWTDVAAMNGLVDEADLGLRFDGLTKPRQPRLRRD